MNWRGWGSKQVMAETLVYTVHCDMMCRITGKVKELSITTQFLQLFGFLYCRFGLVAATGNVSEPRLMSHTGGVCKVVHVYHCVSAIRAMEVPEFVC